MGSSIWKNSPIQLTFFITGKCNASCGFCFYHTDRSGRQETKQTELSIEEIERVSASMGKLLWLAFSGGEIFLRNDLVEITRIFYDKNRPAIILLPTNGLLTDVILTRTEAILKQCKKSRVVLKLSLDGPEEIHDSLRGVRGAFRKTMETFQALCPLLDRYPNFELGFNTVFCSANQDYMDGLIGYVKNLDRAVTHTVSLIRGDVPDTSLKNIDVNKYHHTVRTLESDLREKLSGRYRFRGAKLKTAQDIIQRRLIYETLEKNKRLIKCVAGRLTLVLTEYGDIFPCEPLAKKIGNVRKDGYDVSSLLKTDRAREIIDLIKSNGCRCTHECYFIMNIMFNPLMYPSLALEYMRL